MYQCASRGQSLPKLDAREIYVGRAVVERDGLEDRIVRACRRQLADVGVHRAQAVLIPVFDVVCDCVASHLLNIYLSTKIASAIEREKNNLQIGQTAR